MTVHAQPIKYRYAYYMYSSKIFFCLEQYKAMFNTISVSPYLMDYKYINFVYILKTKPS